MGSVLRFMPKLDMAKKIKNYPVNIFGHLCYGTSNQSIHKKPVMMHLNEISDIDAIGGNRSSSITTAAILLNAMMQEFYGHL
jgi:hypothetical protein